MLLRTSLLAQSFCIIMATDLAKSDTKPVSVKLGAKQLSHIQDCVSKDRA